MAKTIIVGFVAGVLGVLIFHQGVAALLFHVGNQLPFSLETFGRVNAPYNMAPVPPFGIPTVASQAFWGGVWGILLGFILRRSDLPDLAFATIFGALVLTLVAFTVVAYLKGQLLFAGGNKMIWWRAGLYNGAWGFGTALLMRPMALRG